MMIEIMFKFLSGIDAHESDKMHSDELHKLECWEKWWLNIIKRMKLRKLLYFIH